MCYPHQQRSAHFRGILSEVGLSSVSEGAGQDFVVAKSIGQFCIYMCSSIVFHFLY